MTRLVAAVLALSLAACKQEAASSPERASPPAATPSAVPSPQGPGPASAPAAEPVRVAIDDGVVERFVAFDKRYLASLPARLRMMREALASLDKTEKEKGPMVGVASSAQGSQALLEKMKEDDRKLRDAAGISEEQAQAVQELAMALAAVQRVNAPARKENLDAARRRFGDEALAAALRHEKPLVELWAQHMKVFQEAMSVMKGGRQNAR